MSRFIQSTILLVLFAGAALIVSAEGAVPPTPDPYDEADDPVPPAERNGWYTVAQAEAGQEAYIEHCAACHGTDLRGVGPFAPIIGATFMDRWGEQSAAALYSYIHATMPDGAGGSLAEEAYADIFAYLLRRYGHEEGEEPLPADRELLEDLLEQITVRPEE